MRNRAKCKLCKEIIESFHEFDYVSCKCDEIAIDGGTTRYRAYAKNWDNFVRIDDYDNEIKPEILEKGSIVEPVDDHRPVKKEDWLFMLKSMADNLEKLPDHAMAQPISHYDFYSLINLLHEILKNN